MASKARELADAIGERETAGGLVSGRKNLIINGAMQVAQRGTSSTTGGYSTLDRYQIFSDLTDELVLTQSQETDAHDGFSKALKVTVTTPESSIASDERARIRYKTEGYDVQHLEYGTASAKSVTLSFWVKSSVTGTYATYIYQANGNDIIGSTYTINTADTWEYKTITYVGNTAAAINNSSSQGLEIGWILGVGSSYSSTNNTSWAGYTGGNLGYGHSANFITTSGATFYLTGVQLEVGSVATPFEHRSYGEELALCQRYYQSIDYYHDYGSTSSAGNVFYYTNFSFPVTMRATPTMTASAWGSNTGDAFTTYSTTTVNGWVMQDAIPTGCIMRGNHGNIYRLMKGRGKFDAEL